MREVKTTAPGKILLIGGYAINYGKTAIGCAISKRSYCTIEARSDQNIGLKSYMKEETVSEEMLMAIANEVENWVENRNFDKIVDLASSDFHAPQKYILGYFFKNILQRKLEKGFQISIDSEIRPGSGMGSGGSVATALSKALYHAFDIKYDKQKIGLLAYRGDVVAHGGIVSGIDTWTETFGGIVSLKENEQPQIIEVKDFPVDLDIIIADSGIHGLSSKLNSWLKKSLTDNPHKYLVFDGLEEVAQLMLNNIRNEDWERAGKLLYLAYLLYGRLGLFCPEIEELVELMLKEGALGATLTKGRGGIVIAIAPKTKSDNIIEAVSALGKKAFAVSIDTQGVKEIL